MQSPRRREPGRVPRRRRGAPAPFPLCCATARSAGHAAATPGSCRGIPAIESGCVHAGTAASQEPGETGYSDPLLQPRTYAATSRGRRHRWGIGGGGCEAGSVQMPGSLCTPARPTWIRGSTSSSSSSPGSIPSSSSSSSESRAGGGSSAGSSGRLRFGAASMRAADLGARGWRPQTGPEPSGHRPARSEGAARRRGLPGPAQEEVGAVAPSPPWPSAQRSAARSAPSPPALRGPDSRPGRPAGRGSRGSVTKPHSRKV